MKPTAVIQAALDFEMREINALEERIDHAETDADAMLWDQAQRVVEQLNKGLKQWQIAEQWISARTGQPYSQMHVSRVQEVFQTHAFEIPRPRFREAFMKIAHKSTNHTDEIDEPDDEEPSSLDVHHSSESVEHYTPPEILEAVIACLGAIDLDPCSNDGPPNVPAAKHYARTDDGLTQPWCGRVYMNPPYGREIDAWVAKLCEEHAHGGVEEAIALVPARTDTQWFARLRDFKCCFVSGRLTFIGNDDPAPFPSAIVYLGNDEGKFYRCFAAFGDIWERMEPGMFGE